MINVMTGQKLVGSSSDAHEGGTEYTQINCLRDQRTGLIQSGDKIPFSPLDKESEQKVHLNYFLSFIFDNILEKL